MNDPLTKTTALVTGASKGIGRAICVELAKAGHRVIINYRSDDAGAAETLALVEKAGSDGRISRFDVADHHAAEAAVNQIIEQEGAVDILVNNAGLAADGLFLMMPREDWNTVIETSLNGFYNVTKPVLEKMIRKKRGAIVSIASIAGLIGNRGQANYSAAKAGLIGASRSVASEVARWVSGVSLMTVGATPVVPNRRCARAMRATPSGLGSLFSMVPPPPLTWMSIRPGARLAPPRSMWGISPGISPRGNSAWIYPPSSSRPQLSRQASPSNRRFAETALVMSPPGRLNPSPPVPG